MRAAILGAGSIALHTARLLLAQGHEVIIVDSDKKHIDTLAGEIDCGLVHGDGSKPQLLRDLDPTRTDVLFCLSTNDQTNILASLVARSLGFTRVVTRIDDPEFEHICMELGLGETIIPARTISRVLFDMAEGRNGLEMTTMIRDVARVFSFVLHGHEATHMHELDLPEMTRVICFYRDGKFMIPDEDTRLHDNDEIVVISHVRNLAELERKWLAPNSGQ